jgi:hypothetical protein
MVDFRKHLRSNKDMTAKKTADKKGASRHNDNNQEPEVKGKPSTSLTTKKTLTKEQVEALLVADEGAGSENIGAKDMAIPRISILQKGSPQCDKAEGAYIKGAEPGDFYDNVANKVFAKGVSQGQLGVDHQEARWWVRRRSRV